MPSAISGGQAYAGVFDSHHQSLQDVLRARAKSHPSKGLAFYSVGSVSLTPLRVSYATLLEKVLRIYPSITLLPGFIAGCPVVLRLDDHWDAIVWLWAVLFAGGLPAIAPELRSDDDQRKRQLQELSGLLQSPITITRASSLPLFEGDSRAFKLHTVEALLETVPNDSDTRFGKDTQATCSHAVDSNSTAILMLTSGSSGAAKAVQLSHEQIIAAASGKASVRPLPVEGTFFNWIGLDHVASLVEIHFQALWLGRDQIHAHAVDIVSSPSQFLYLLSKHHVARSFAPNFFLAKLVATCSAAGGSDDDTEWDLSRLTVVASGGEANIVHTCAAASEIFARYGAPANVITTGFGMTETCAGSIFNLDCPRYDVQRGRAIASLGRCMPGIEMRVAKGDGQMAGPDEIGDLEVRGAVVFKGYYRNDVATKAAFTLDGWFRTGDQAYIDTGGHLSLGGRAKDVINLNGVKVATSDFQLSLDSALRSAAVIRAICFPSRAPGASTEQVTVAYLPSVWPADSRELVEIDKLARKACVLVSAAAGQPCIFAVGPEASPLLPTSTLGKISGAKMRTLFEEGAFAKDISRHNQVVDAVEQWHRQLMTAATETSLIEAAIQSIISDIGGHAGLIGLETSIFEYGFSSMDIIRLKHRLDNVFGVSVPAILIMKNPTVPSLAAVLEECQSHQASPARLSSGTLSSQAPSSATNMYDPIVTLCPSGSKTPLWLVHPGVGEILVFVGLAQHMRADDRPVYALRARGFEPGHANFSSIDEAVDAYVDAVRRRQPTGPYALAGYSYGTMLAFEMAKRLEETSVNSAAGAGVRFLGSFNLPPHIKMRMRQLNWNMCLLNLTQFLGLVDNAAADRESTDAASSYRQLPREDAMDWVLSLSDTERMEVLGLGPHELRRWADVAFGLQSMAVDYDPRGSVPAIDVFHAEPLAAAAPSREEWVSKQLIKWRDFSQTEPRLHRVGGAHYTMLGADHVASFSVTLRASLCARGI